MRLAWYDLQGSPGSTLGELGLYGDPAISPDGSRVAVAVGAPGSARDIWIMDIARGTTTRFTFDKAADEAPVWSPDGKDIVFASTRGQRDLYIKPADGSGEERLLLKSGEPKTPFAWSKDGRFLVFVSASQKTESISGLCRLPHRHRLHHRPIRPRFRCCVPSSLNSTLRFRLMVSGSLICRWNPARQRSTCGRSRQTQTEAVLVGPSGWCRGARFLFLAPPGDGRPTPFTVVLNWEASLKR
jgi:tricorn protease-like protein